MPADLQLLEKANKNDNDNPVSQLITTSAYQFFNSCVGDILGDNFTTNGWYERKAKGQTGGNYTPQIQEARALANRFGRHGNIVTMPNLYYKSQPPTLWIKSGNNSSEVALESDELLDQVLKSF